MQQQQDLGNIECECVSVESRLSKIQIFCSTVIFTDILDIINFYAVHNYPWQFLTMSKETMNLIAKK